MSDVVVVVCPNCMQKYRVPEDRIGRHAVCKRCGERFKVARQPDIDDDTVYGWIAAEDPAGTSVMGSTSIFAATNGEEAGTAQRWRRPPPPKTPRVNFVHLDKGGAAFEFEAVLLEVPELRCSFPHRCVRCLSPKDLSVHFLIWGDKLPRADALRLQESENRAVRQLEKLLERDGEEWFDRLEPVVVLPRPFCHPFPYCVCRVCGTTGEVHCSLTERGGIEFCRLTIANLTVALDFYRNNGGRGQPAYQRLLVARRQQRDNQWENLPYAVRTRLSTWFTRHSDEKFLGFYADEDFNRAEAGVAGLVLTDQRIVCKKYSRRREYYVREGGRLHIEATRGRATIEISQKGKEETECTTLPLAAGALARTLSELSQAWQVSVQTSEV